MAIDTKAKRTSAVGSRRLPWLRRFTPAPDGTVEQADRQSVGFVYGGIEAAEDSNSVVGTWSRVVTVKAGKQITLYSGHKIELKAGEKIKVL